MKDNQPLAWLLYALLGGMILGQLVLILQGR